MSIDYVFWEVYKGEQKTPIKIIEKGKKKLSEGEERILIYNSYHNRIEINY